MEVGEAVKEVMTGRVEVGAGGGVMPGAGLKRAPFWIQFTEFAREKVAAMGFVVGVI
jgi:hypothetical protein